MLKYNVGQCESSSQKCHKCGYMNKRIKELSNREWGVSAMSDKRDVNAILSCSLLTFVYHKFESLKISLIQVYRFLKRS